MKKIVSFKVEPALAEFLASLPNKSEFVRQAVLAQFGMTCPLCTGSGVIPRGVGDHFAEEFRRHGTRACAGCGREEPVPRTIEGGPDADRPGPCRSARPGRRVGGDARVARVEMEARGPRGSWRWSGGRE